MGRKNLPHVTVLCFPLIQCWNPPTSIQPLKIPTLSSSLVPALTSVSLLDLSAHEMDQKKNKVKMGDDMFKRKKYINW